jgi:hypothetical protein
MGQSHSSLIGAWSRLFSSAASFDNLGARYPRFQLPGTTGPAVHSGEGNAARTVAALMGYYPLPPTGASTFERGFPQIELSVDIAVSLL